jgi:hypothetical protein
MSEDEAITKGLEKKAVEFQGMGAEVYRKV